MPIRKTPLVTDHVYHVVSRGVNRALIFKDKRDYQRFLDLVGYCVFKDYPVKFSLFKSFSREKRERVTKNLKTRFVDIISFCLMPNHFHFGLRQRVEDGIKEFMGRLLTSYAKYFNMKHKRSGPLFQGRFKAILVETDEQLLYLVRYIHLNPYSSLVVDSFKNLLSYPWSSFQEYLDPNLKPQICNEKKIVLANFKNTEDFKKFTLDRADYQKELEKIKHLILE